MSNGRTLELNENEATLTTSVPNGKVLVDGLGVGDVGNIVYVIDNTYHKMD